MTVANEMNTSLILLLAVLMCSGCSEPKNETGIPILTHGKAQRYIQEVEKATYVNGVPDVSKLREFALTHPDSYKVYEWNGPGYEGFLGGLFLFHVSQDLPEDEQAKLNELMDDLRTEFMKRQQAAAGYRRAAAPQPEP